MESIFNHWTKVRITDKEVRKLIQKALIPSKEVLQRLEAGLDDQCSTYYKNMCDFAYRYTMENETQQVETTKGTLFGTYNGITGYYQNVRKYKDDTAKLRSLMYNGTGQQRGQAAFDLCQAFDTDRSFLNN